MAIIVRYVVEHKGVEKMVTTDKKEADLYDKMLDVADNLAAYIDAKGISLQEPLLEELTVLLAKNKETVNKLFKGASAAEILEQEKAEVVALQKKQA